MSKRLTTKPRQQVFEAKYARGYRYLDRCGQVMVELEDLLSELTSCIWLPSEVAPTGAKMKCPDRDLYLVFDAHRCILDQNPMSDVEIDFSTIAATCLSTLVGRFDIRKFMRFGARRIRAIPASSISEAEALSVGHPYLSNSNVCASDMSVREFEQLTRLETDDGKSGVRILTKPYHKLGAEVELDARLRLPPHQLPDGQREALLEQLKRAKERETDPRAGVFVDIDYYRIAPDSQTSVIEFLATAWKMADEIQEDLLANWKMR